MAIRLKDNDASPMISINTTPLIDVMLVLLIMLIITIPVELHSINMDTPDNATVSPSSTEQIVTIVINATNQFEIDHVVLSQDELDRRLLALSKSPTQPEIHITPNSNAQFNSLAHLLATAQNLKLTKIGIDDGSE
ncbi:biopolymer transporter ExbD [Ferrovum sp. PN-J185]|uniref:ExbD/TolR family protein n=1 Tax=Ferrovum sp. PN-J185 TaxID=1356306 RepID=UPI000794F626|nr:biopolymer transporter ExbD [Ferrovum sp. PN-J185]KXW56112.1 biopolymer transport protein ExbD [Ferrovum sp. PN-J185]MCC6067826.1 biopolymer transporter ExbD [Ferrovum sp. PN-J185]